MTARIVWYALLVLVAAITVGVQIDRQSAVHPAFADLTPEPLRGFAQAQLTARALREGGEQAALAEAQTLVSHRPMPAESLRALAQAQLLAGQEDAALAAIQLAAQRGWRDPAAQEAMLRIALAAGDEAEAARRYTALFLQSRTDEALLAEYGAQVFADGGGVAAQTLAEIVAGTGRWQGLFLQRGARVLPPDTFAAITVAARRRGAQFDCAALENAAASTARASTAASASLARLIAADCAQ